MKRPFSGEESGSRERQSPDWRSQKTSPKGGTENPFYQGHFPLFHSPGLQPLQRKGHLSWGDASLAPGWYKSAPLALNYGFWAPNKEKCDG
jgi:hypothetical protein